MLKRISPAMIVQTKIDKLYQEIINGIDEKSLKYLFGKALIYAELIKDNEIRDWCSLELSGYGAGDKIPNYRMIPVTGFGVKGNQIYRTKKKPAILQLEDLYFRVTYPYRESVEKFEDLVLDRRGLKVLTVVSKGIIISVGKRHVKLFSYEYEPHEIKPFVEFLRQLLLKRIIGSNPTASHKVSSDFLNGYSEIYNIYNEALSKFYSEIFTRNLIDDLRLTTELLLKRVLNNDKSLENQINPLGLYFKQKQSSSEINNMFCRLLDYYNKYQNNYIKHNDKVNKSEVLLIIDLTTAFMKFIVSIENS